MDSSTKRKVGAIALIVAGIGAFLVPFLLHGPALQASNNGGGNTNSNNNNGGTGRTPTSTNCTTDCTPPCTANCTPPSSTCTTSCPTDTTPPGCTTDTSTNSHSGENSEGKQVAKGHDNQDKRDTSLAGQAHSFMAALGKHNPLHDATHSTKTDNDTTNNHGLNSSNHDIEDTNACADNKDNESSDNPSNGD